MNTQWKQKNGNYGSWQEYFVGTIRVAKVEYNGSRARGDKLRSYRWFIMLPGFKNSEGFKPTEDEAKVVIEKMVANWNVAFNA